VNFFPGVVFLVKDVPLICFGCLYTSLYKYLTLATPYIQPNSDFFSAKIKHSTIHHANRQICNASYNDQNKWSESNFPISYILVARLVKTYVSCARTCRCCTRSHVALNTYDIHVDDIYQRIRFMLLSRAPARNSTKIPTASQCCEVLQNLSKVHLISFLIVLLLAQVISEKLHPYLSHCKNVKFHVSLQISLYIAQFVWCFGNDFLVAIVKLVVCWIYIG